MSMDTLEAALKYLELGWSVIPIHKESKRPCIKWKRHQTELPTSQEWTKWAKTWPDCNIALICGQLSGVFAIDFDSGEALEYYKEKYDSHIEDTLCQKTGKGLHAIYNTHGTVIPLIQPVLEKTDLKGDRSYILIEPSIHKNGTPYQWTHLNPLIDGTDDILDFPPCVRDMIEDYKDCCSGSKKRKKTSHSGYGDAAYIEKPRNPDGWMNEALMGTTEGGRNTQASKIIGGYLNKGLGKEEMNPFLSGWNTMNTEKLEGKEVNGTYNSISKKAKEEEDHGLKGAVKKITVFRYPDGTSKYRLLLRNDKFFLIQMGDLFSSMKTVEKIAEVTGVIFDPPKQARWLEIVREWYQNSDEQFIDVEESELGVIKEIIASWLVQWDQQKDSKHINLQTMLGNNCVVQDEIVYFTLTHLEEDLRFKNAKITRTLLCEFLKRLGSKVTEKRKRFDGSRIRTWEIPSNMLE